MMLGGMVVDAASGSGVAQPGNVPFTFTRSSTGVYDIKLLNTMNVLSCMVTPATGGRCNLAVVTGLGTFQAQISTDTGALANGNFSFMVMVRGQT